MKNSRAESLKMQSLLHSEDKTAERCSSACSETWFWLNLVIISLVNVFILCHRSETYWSTKI